MYSSIRDKILNKKKSDSDTVTDSNKEAQLERSIKAFRTITTMLSVIPSQRAVKVVDHKPGRLAAEEKELKLLNALATLLVRHNEVAAIAVTKRDDGSGVVQTVACHNVGSDGSSESAAISHPALSSQASASGFWSFLAAINPRKDTPFPTSDCPAIIDPNASGSIPSDIRETKDTERIWSYCHQIWREETHITHAWMLGRFVGNFVMFQEYVVAACFKKIVARMDNGLSLPYLEAMKSESLSNFQFKETDLNPEEKEIQMERTFQTTLRSLAKAGLLKTPVINLLAVIDEGSDELYTKNTCREFHLLLCELLSKLHQYLKELELLNSPVQTKFERVVRLVVCYGEALQTVAGGVAIQRHLQVIEGELSILHHKRARDAANLTTLPNVEANEEDDIELQNVQPSTIRDGVALPMSKAAKDWLKLMVVHFDAIKIVTAHYRTFRLTKLVIKIIVPPLSDHNMLPWKDLLKDAKYIEFVNDSYNPLNLATSDEIINFLDKHACTDNLGIKRGSTPIVPMMKNVNKLVQSSSSEAVSIDDLKTMEIQLSGLRDGMSPDQARLTSRISSTIEQLRNRVDESSKPSRRELLYNIVEMLESLNVSSSFFRKLRKGTPLSSGNNFDGVPHCELILAALIAMGKSLPLALPEGIQEDLSNAGHVLGISKPSCPVCFEVLKTLSLSCKPFVFRGSHSTISACTLPKWLPIDVINGVAKTFGALLKEDLIKLVRQRDTITQGRPRTSQSGTLSMSSNDGATEDLFGGNNINRDEYYAYVKR